MEEVVFDVEENRYILSDGRLLPLQDVRLLKGMLRLGEGEDFYEFLVRVRAYGAGLDVGGARPQYYHVCQDDTVDFLQGEPCESSLELTLRQMYLNLLLVE